MTPSDAVLHRSGQAGTVLVVGATGSIGALVVEEVLRDGYRVRALVRDRKRGAKLPAGTELAVGDLTDPVSLDL